MAEQPRGMARARDRIRVMLVAWKRTKGAPETTNGMTCTTKSKSGIFFGEYHDIFMVLRLTSPRSEKHSNKEQALARLKAGENFDVVARAFAEHKRSDGKSSTILSMGSTH